MSDKGPPLTVGDSAALPGDGDCGCCADAGSHVLPPLFNRPGLPAISYRVGTHSRFKSAILAQISSAKWPMLGGLRTRDDDDFSIALIDAWATVSDVLTFYQERVANEAFLRTATETLSVRELARLIGYKPRPGVAAGSYLAFLMEEAPGAPEQAVKAAPVPAGTRAQSIPGPGEKAQTFETIEEIEARVAWNLLRPRLRAPSLPGIGGTHIWLDGTATNLRPGDAVLLVDDARAADPGSERWDFRRVAAVEPDSAANATRIVWSEGLSSIDPVSQPAANPRVYALRLRASLFGYNAPHPFALHDSVKDNYPAAAFAPSGDWNFTIAAKTVDLEASYPGILKDSWVVLSKPGDQELYRVTAVAEAARASFAISGKATRVTFDTEESLSGYSGDNYRNTAAFAQSENLPIAEGPIETPVWRDEIELDRKVEGLTKGRILMIRGKRARVTVLAATLNLTNLGGSTVKAIARGQSLVLMAAPATVAGSDGLKSWHLRDAVGFEGRVTAAADAFAFAAPAKDDEIVAEAAALKAVELADPRHSRLLLDGALENAYDRASTEILANVARATHGETVSEILGSGKAGQPYQSFTLKQAPLTYVSADSPTGTASTLQIRVNDVLWKEVSNLLGRGPEERVYVTRATDEGKLVVQFGDGRTGARLPSGQDNVRAIYRKGIGLEGLVDAGQISNLLTRPLGVKSGVNPLPATGAADPEKLEDARENAPVTVLTLDRAVSLQDYEDFARGFAGVAKAQAVWTWDGQTRRVFVTVAGPGGAIVDDDSDLYKHLSAALANSGDPFVAFSVASYRQATFKIALKVKPHPDHLADKVLKEVETALRARFSFALRGFGQTVSMSEVIAAAQAVSGVVAIDLDRLYRTTPPFASVALHPRLTADRPALGPDGAMIGAELLTLDPGPLDWVTVMP